METSTFEQERKNAIATLVKLGVEIHKIVSNDQEGI